MKLRATKRTLVHRSALLLAATALVCGVMGPAWAGNADAGAGRSSDRQVAALAPPDKEAVEPREGEPDPGATEPDSGTPDPRGSEPAPDPGNPSAVEPSPPTPTPTAATGDESGEARGNSWEAQSEDSLPGLATASPETDPAAAAATTYIIKSSSSPIIAPGQEITYTMAATCTSVAVDCIGFTVWDDIPAEFDIVALPSPTSERDVTYNALLRRVAIAYKIPVTGGVGVPAGMTVTVDVQVRLPQSTSLPDGYAISNTATSFASNAQSAISSTISVVVTIPALQITKSASREQVEPGQTLNYTIEATCLLAADCEGFTVEDQIPAGLSIESLPTPSAEYDVTWDANTRRLTVVYKIPLTGGGFGMPSGQTGTLAIGTLLPFPSPVPDGTVLTNAARLTATNTSTVATSLVNTTVAIPAVALTKSAAPTQVAPGGTLTYTLVASCTSTAPCAGFTVTDTLPSTLTVGTLPASNSDRTVSYDPVTRVLTVTYNVSTPSGPGLPAGASDTLDVGMALPADTPLPVGSVVTNTGTASAAAAAPADASADITVLAPPTGSVSVAKALAGNASSVMSQATFTVHVTCERDTPSGTETLVDTDVLVPAGQTVAVPGAGTTLPVGARCWGAETNSVGATSVAVDYNQANPVTVTAGHLNVVITATNTYTAGGNAGGDITASGVRIAATVSGSAAAYAQGPFRFETICTLGGFTLPTQVTELSPTSLVGYVQPLPTGANCTVTQTAQGTATGTVPRQIGQVTVPAPDAQPAEVTSDNAFPGSQLTVAKVVVGPGTAASYGFQVTCYAATPGAPPVVSEALSIPPGQSKYLVVPTGISCNVTETDAGGAASTTYSQSGGGTGGDVVMNADTTVTVTNTFGVTPTPTPTPTSSAPVTRTGGTGSLPTTGNGSGAPLALLGLGLLVLGVMFRLSARRRV